MTTQLKVIVQEAFQKKETLRPTIDNKKISTFKIEVDKTIMNKEIRN